MTAASAPVGPYPADVRWAYRSLRSGLLFEQVHLTYGWEVNWSTFSDDFTPEEAAAPELWERYVRTYGDRILADGEFGPGAVRIAWFVQGEGPGAAHFEGAPFQVRGEGFAAAGDEDFLTHYSAPSMMGHEIEINWLRVPVMDYAWVPGRGDKAGWFQQATGWKPSPLQPSVSLSQLARAAGLPFPAN